MNVKETRYKLSQPGDGRIGVPYAELSDSGFIVVKGEYYEKKSQSDMRDMHVLGISQLFSKGEHENINIKIDVDVVSRPQAAVTIWIDDGDGVFDKTRDKEFKLYADSKQASQTIIQPIIFH